MPTSLEHAARVKAKAKALARAARFATQAAAELEREVTEMNKQQSNSGREMRGEEQDHGTAEVRRGRA